VALAPCLAFAGAAGWAVSDQWARRAEMDRVKNLVGLALRISAFAHEALRERGASSLFLSAEGAQFGPELAAQRRAVDAFSLSAPQAVGFHNGLIGEGLGLVRADGRG
jgi:hypothetical protein